MRRPRRDGAVTQNSHHIIIIYHMRMKPRVLVAAFHQPEKKKRERSPESHATLCTQTAQSGRERESTEREHRERSVRVREGSTSDSDGPNRSALRAAWREH